MRMQQQEERQFQQVLHTMNISISVAMQMRKRINLFRNNPYSFVCLREYPTKHSMFYLISHSLFIHFVKSRIEFH